MIRDYHRSYQSAECNDSSRSSANERASQTYARRKQNVQALLRLRGIDRSCSTSVCDEPIGLCRLDGNHGIHRSAGPRNVEQNGKRGCHAWVGADARD